MTNPEELERAAERVSRLCDGWTAEAAEKASAITLFRVSDVLLILSANREMREALEPFAAVGEAVDVTDFGQALFPDGGTAFGCEWSTNGEHSRLVWSDFRRARLALTTQRGDGE